MLNALIHAGIYNLIRIFALPAALIIFIFVVMRLLQWLRIDEPAKTPEPSHLISSRNYMVPIHLHVIDFDRSRMTVLPTGGVVAQCCVQGCDLTVTIGRDVANATIAEDGVLA